MPTVAKDRKPAVPASKSNPKQIDQKSDISATLISDNSPLL
jgi:hypothetical protein